MIIMGIDPGPTHSGVVVGDFDLTSNLRPLELLWTSREAPAWEKDVPAVKERKEGTIRNDHLFLNLIPYMHKYRVEYVIFEGMEHRGKSQVVGGAVFQSLLWIGIFNGIIMEGKRRVKSGPTYWPLFREIKVKTHILMPSTVRTILTGTPRTSKNEIKNALIERHGEIGTKSNPGLLYPLAKPRNCKHLFDALAVAQAFADMTPDQRNMLPLAQWYWSDKK